MSDVITARNRHNVLVRHHGASDPRTREAAAELRAARIAALIKSAPPLTSGQVDRLRGLLPAPELDEPGGTAMPAGASARRVAAELPPLTETDVVQLGQVAAVIDQRHAAGGDRP